jgi:protein involved in polysaccharide export with SLBB domain
VTATLFYPRAFHAQCADDSDPDALACQAQDGLTPSTGTQEAPAVFQISGPDAKHPHADLSNEASAVGSLANGSSYTERPSGEVPPPRPAQLPPEPLSEFQRFVAATTGHQLHVYGTGLFARQTAFGPVNNAPAPDGLILGADDELRIRIWGQVNFSASLRVSREGDIYLPKIGAVHVAGMTVTAAQDHLRRTIDRVYRNYELTVDLGEIHSIQVYVTGMARQPGEYTVSALSTLVDAAFLSGGPSSAGSMRHILLRRGGEILTDFDLYELVIKGDKTGDRQLLSGDVLYIPATGPQVALLGSVRQPAIFELRGEQTLDGLLATAGGRTAMAAGSRISIDRIADRARRSAFEVADNPEGLRTSLVDGDIVSIDPIASNYRNTVTLRGSVANPGRFGWRPGMRLSNLIPDRDSLLSRGYWWRRTQLGLPAPEFFAIADLPPAAKFSSKAGNSGPSPIASELSTTSPVPTPGGQTDWDYAVIERLDRSTMTTSLLSFNLGKLVLQHDAEQDLALEAGDVITIFSQDDIHLPADRKTKYVRLEGEVANAGVYSVSPGENLRSLVERAGGLTPKAYLYGAEFTRESTRALEQQRLDEYSDHLEHLLLHSELMIPGMQGGSGQNESPDAFASTAQGMVGRLRQISAKGRIVIELSPQSRAVSDLPEMELEDGDRLVIPSRPSTVQVIGAVFNQNAFLCAPGAKVGSYLRLAGGVTREADRHRIFVLRADGSVVHRADSNSIFAPCALDSLRLFAGDTIVVPEKIVRSPGMRELAAWTQIMSQLSLSAAAINVIK